MRRLAANTSLAIACIVAAGASVALAQQPSSSSLDKRWPGDPPAQQQAPAQAAPAQAAPQARPAAPAQVAPQQRPAAAQPQQQPAARQPAADSAQQEAAPPKAKPQPATPRVVACSGVFARESNHLKLATAFGNDNVSWTQVDGPDSTKLNATVLFSKDPKRRLEVLWNIEASRSDTQLIVINGQSTWTGPKGLKLGMTLAALEKLNGKPFVMKGFKGDTGGMVTSWEEGALSKLAGGCRVGIRLAPDPKAPAPPTGQDDALVSDKDFVSNMPAIKPLSPKIAEIIVGY
jgi:hypothetical protein